MTKGDQSQAEPVNYDKMLMIGLGGSGIRAVRTALLYGQRDPATGDALDPALATCLEKGRVVAVGVDTDTDEFGQSPVLPAAFPRAIRLQLERTRSVRYFPILDHVVQIPRDEMDEAIGLARRMQRHREEKGSDAIGDASAPARLVDEFLPISEKHYDTILAAGEEVNQGAGQLRALGRIGFLCSMEDIHNILETALRDLGATRGGRGIRVAIFCSLAGGTGSGMFLDVALLIRRILARRASLAGFFLLPEVFAAASHIDRIWANGYAALKELSVLSRPQNQSPVHFNYRMRGDDKKFVVQKGDPPVFEDIYLFDDSAMLVDGEVDPDLRRDSEIAAASRAMADVALALNRRDLSSTNKNKQNGLIGRARGTAETRRIYHTARSWPMRPEDPGQLGSVLFLSAVDRFIRSPIRNLKDSTPPRPAMRDLEELRLALLSGPDLATQDTKGAGATEARSSWKAGVEKFLQPLIKITDKNARSDLNRFKSDLNPENFQDWLKKALGSELFAIFETWIYKLKPHDLNRHRYLCDEGLVSYDIPLADIFRDYFENQKIDDCLADLDRRISDMKTRLAYLSDDVEAQFQTLLDSIGSAKIKHGDGPSDNNAAAAAVTVRAPEKFFQERVAFNAYVQEKEEHARRLRRNILPGPFVEDIQAIAGHIVETVRSSLTPEDHDDVATPIKVQAVDSYVRRHLEWTLGRRIEELLRLSRTNRDRLASIEDLPLGVARHRYGLGGLTVPQQEVARFARIFEPLSGMVEQISVEERTGDGGPATGNRLRRGIVNGLAECLGKVEHGNDQDAEKIIRDLTEAMVGGRDRDLSGLVHRIAEVLAGFGFDKIERQLLSRQHADGGRRGGAGGSLDDTVRNQLVSYVARAEAFVQFWLAEPKFELTRLGGEAGIREASERCQLSVFVKSRAPGEYSSRYVTVALPNLGKDITSAVEDGAKKAIRRTIGLQLQCDPIIASLRSMSPVIFHESRSHAGYQINRIDRYHDHYNSLADEIKPLFHVISGGELFPDVDFDEAVVDEATRVSRWLCPRHGEHDVAISTDEMECPRCMEEYRTGTRRYAEVSRRSRKDGVTIPGGAAVVSLIKVVPESLTSYFWNGPPDEELSFDKSRTGPFEARLRDAGFSTELSSSVTVQRKGDHRIFPSVFNPQLSAWEWVHRSPQEEGAFVRFTEPEQRLYECFHCGFPTALPVDQPAAASWPCPRCRREIEPCFYCSSSKGFLYQPLVSETSNARQCPQCELDMDPPVNPERVDSGGDVPDPASAARGEEDRPVDLTGSST